MVLIATATATAPAAAAPPVAGSAASTVSPIARQYALAEQAYRAADWPQAERLYTTILESHGDESFAWFRVGLMQQRRHAFRNSLNAYDNALASASVVPTESTAEVIDQVHYNRALLLMESAAADLQGIKPGVLEPGLDMTRDALNAHLGAALRAAGSQQAPADTHHASTPDHESALGFVYEARPAALRPAQARHP